MHVLAKSLLLCLVAFAVATEAAPVSRPIPEAATVETQLVPSQNTNLHLKLY
jgi:hypothetical protein